VKERVVVDGNWVFAAGLTAGIDGALRLAGELRGDEAAQTIQLYMVYASEPPFDSGTPETAPAAILVFNCTIFCMIPEARIPVEVSRDPGRGGVVVFCRATNRTYEPCP
jgi:hypothetical protein